MWVSSDGVCAFTSGSVTVITKDKLNKVKFNPISAVSYNEQYMLVLDDGSVFISDLRFGGNTLKYLNYIDADVYNLCVFDSTLYGVVNEQLSTIDTGELIDFYYESPHITEGDASVVKLYNSVYIKASGRFIIDILIDDRLVVSDELVGNKIFELKVPQDKQRGSYIQFKVQGTGIVNEIEYKVVGRENGR
jgi:hypothetical protein